MYAQVRGNKENKSFIRRYKETMVFKTCAPCDFDEDDCMTTKVCRPLQSSFASSDPNIFRTLAQQDAFERKQTRSLEIRVEYLTSWESNHSLEDIRKPPVLPPRKRQNKYKKRLWLANAIQAHMQDLAQHIIFRDSELPDLLLSETCITEDECEVIRKAPNRKNQIRRLVQMIVGRDFAVLERFLQHIRSQSQLVYDKIKQIYKQNEDSSLYEDVCAVCLLEMYFDIEDAAEALWAKNLINADLYRRVVWTEVNASHTQLWKDLFQYINSLELGKRESAYLQLKEAVDRKQTYKYLSSEISECWNTYKKLRCSCKNEPELFMSRGSNSSTDTSYPKTSTSSLDLSTSDTTEAIRTTQIDIHSKQKLFTKVESVQKLRSTVHDLKKSVDDSQVSEPMHEPHFVSFGAAESSVNVLVPTKVETSQYKTKDEPTDTLPKKGLVLEKVAHFEMLTNH